MLVGMNLKLKITATKGTIMKTKFTQAVIALAISCIAIATYAATPVNLPVKVATCAALYDKIGAMDSSIFYASLKPSILDKVIALPADEMTNNVFLGVGYANGVVDTATASMVVTIEKNNGTAPDMDALTKVVVKKYIKTYKCSDMLATKGV